MPTLGQIIREIQHDCCCPAHRRAASRDRDESRRPGRAIDLYYTIPPGGRTVEDLIIANSTVLVSVLTTALYVRELTTRPAVTSVAVVITPN